MRRLSIAFACSVLMTLVVSGTAAAAPYEPNDNLLQAYGPLVGGSNYEMVLETANDNDWLYFYTAGQAQIGIRITTIAGPDQCDWASAYLADENGSVIHALSVRDQTGSYDEYFWTSPGAKKFTVWTSGYKDYAVGCKLRVTVNPAGALTSVVPPDDLAITTCKTSQSNVTTYTGRLAVASQAQSKNAAKLAATKRKLRRAKNRYSRATLRRKIRTLRRRVAKNKTQVGNYQALLTGANNQVSQSCTPQVLELIRNVPSDS